MENNDSISPKEIMISQNIKEEIKKEDFYKMNIDEMKNVLETCKCLNSDSIVIFLHNIKKTYPENYLNFLKYIKCEEGLDNKHEEIIRILEELNEIPLMKEIKKIIESHEPSNDEIIVNWEKLYETEKKKSSKYIKELETMIVKYNILFSMLKRKAPHEEFILIKNPSR